jgi:hypothetical protein
MSKKPKKSKKGARSGSKKPKKAKKGARGSTAKRGASRSKLSAHVGFDFASYMQARSFALRAQKALGHKKMPEIRKVETKKAEYGYVVIVPHGKITPAKLKALVAHKKAK